MTLLLIAMSLWGAGVGAESSVVAPSARLEKLAGGFKFTEGPASDAQGNVFFTDQPNDRIVKWGVDGKLSTFMQPCGRSNGLCFDRHGNMWACADAKNELWVIDPAGKVTVVVYLTGKGVFVFDRAGHEIEHVDVPEPWTANVCFGGKDRQTLFITASKGLYGLRMRVKGAGSQ